MALNVIESESNSNWSVMAISIMIFMGNVISAGSKAGVMLDSVTDGKVT